ncbi:MULTISPECIES: hypothetical protein [unclassified Campylobacter]|uniref:hypothetical protein n=1 Tax=unclassified Campylobacter TaxID=2593542 RepID=UPI0016816C46|nr:MULTISPECIES: hypothetical protein [unclassified Campylobacter]
MNKKNIQKQVKKAKILTKKFSKDTLRAIKEIENGEVEGPFYNINDLMQSLEK